MVSKHKISASLSQANSPSGIQPEEPEALLVSAAVINRNKPMKHFLEIVFSILKLILLLS